MKKQGCFTSIFNITENCISHDIIVSFLPNGYSFKIDKKEITSVQLFYSEINEDMAERMKKIVMEGAIYYREEFEEWFNEVLKADNFLIRWADGCVITHEGGYNVFLGMEKIHYNQLEGSRLYELIIKERQAKQ